MVVQTKNWLVVWNIFPYTGNFIIPTDFPIFQRGRYTTNQRSMGIELIVLNFLSCHMFFFTGFAEMVICLEKSSETETLPGLRNLWRICMLYFMICCCFLFFSSCFLCYCMILIFYISLVIFWYFVVFLKQPETSQQCYMTTKQLLRLSHCNNFHNSWDYLNVHPTW